MNKKKVNEKEESQKILDRISRIEGQLRGIKRMIEKKDECIDIVAQIMAIREAVGSLGIELMKNDFICKKKEGIDENYLKTLFKIK